MSLERRERKEGVANVKRGERKREK